MNRMTMMFMAATIAAGASGVALAQSSHQGHGAHGTPPAAAAPGGQMDAAAMQTMMQAMMPASGDTPSTKDFKAADMKMMHDMQAAYTGDPDVDFRIKMIPHHQGAIDMAKVALQHAKDADTKRMAQKIIEDQEKEIAEMRTWLKKNGKM